MDDNDNNPAPDKTGDNGDKSEPDKKTFTQDQVNDIVSKRLSEANQKADKQVKDEVAKALAEAERQSKLTESKYGPINSVVLARTPAEDNIAVTDNASVEENGLTEIKLANNEILDDDRETLAQPILDEIDGFYFYPFEATTEGHGWYETGDRVTITDGTTLDSPNGAKEFIAGVVDFGSFDIAGNIVDGVQVSALYDVFNGQQNRNFEIETPSGTMLALSGYFSAFGFGEKTTDGLDTFKATVRVSGAPTYTPASA